MPVAIPDGTCAVDYAYAKTGRFDIQCYVFARLPASPSDVLAGVLRAGSPGAAIDTSLPAATPDEIAQAKRVRWLTPEETSILLIDHAASLAWNGVFDAKGRNAISRGEPNAYERLGGDAWVSIRAARAFVLHGPSATDWIPAERGGAVVRHRDGELLASAIGRHARSPRRRGRRRRSSPAIWWWATAARVSSTRRREGASRARRTSSTSICLRGAIA